MYHTRRITVAIVALLGLFATPKLEAQNFSQSDIAFERLTVKQGLSQGTVLCMVQDRRGFMWFGTEDGLNRWDGHSFKIFRSNPRDTSSLARNYIEALYEDKEGALWIGTKSGLCRFNRTSETFTTFRADGKPQSLSNGYVTSIVDDARGEYLWVGTYGGGLCRMDKKTGLFATYRKNSQDAGALQSDIVWRLAADKTGAIWVGTYEGGLYRYMSSSNNFLRFSPDSVSGLSWRGNDIQSLWTDRLGMVWIGTNRSGLWRFEYRPISRSGEFTHFAHDPANPATLGSSKIVAVLETRSGTLWAATDNGLSEMTNRALEQFRTYRRERAETESLVNDEVLSLYEDKSGTVWVGTRDGISFFNPRTRKFLTYRALPNMVRGLSSNAVWAFAEDSNGKIWIGTEDGLNRMESQALSGGGGVFEVFRASDVLPNQLGENFISALHTARDGALWVGTNQTGLYVLRQTNVYGKANFEHFLSVEGDERSLASNSISSIIEDKNGATWIATDRGASRFDGIDASGKAQFTNFRRTPTAPDHSLAGDLVYALYQDRAGVMWIGTESGLTRLDPKTGLTKIYHVESGRPESLSDNSIQAIYEDKAGNLWLATEGGLNIFDRATEKFSVIEQQQEGGDAKIAEALKGTILAIQEDKSGTLWLSTNQGLVRFTPKTGDMRLYDARDGLQGTEFTTGAALTSKNGVMFFGGTNGFSVFHPDSLRANSTIPEVVFTNFTQFGKPIPLDTAIAEKRFIVLRYDRNNFEIQFAALSFSFASRNRYRYKLEGFDTDWHYADVQQYDARYTNLDPKEYTFRVQACNYDGVWNETGAALVIEITPPFWVRWWFRGAMAVLLLGGSVGFVRWRVKAVEERNKTLESLVDQRTKELQDSNEEIKQQIKEIERQNGILDEQAAEIELKNSELQEANTALKASEEQRMMERAHLSESEKMASLGRLTNGVAHEINNPVNFISGAVKPLKRNLNAITQILEQYSRITPERLTPETLSSVQQHLREIADMKEDVQIEARLKQIDDLVGNIGVGAERIAEIVKSLRTLYRPEEEALKTASVHEGIDATIKLLYNQSKYHHIAIQKEYSPDVPDILCYPGPMNQVFMNILHNAIQAIGEKGEVRITTALQANNPKNVVVKIRDTGRGMSAETLDKIFDAGFTTKKDGMGIGLAISKDIIEGKHKGSISAVSEIGVGTEFTVILPLDGPHSVR